MKKSLWLEVTQDKYELPVAVASNPYELAEMTGTTPGGIKSMVSKYKHGKVKQCRWRKVEVEDEDDEEKSKDYSICHIMHFCFYRL